MSTEAEKTGKNEKKMEKGLFLKFGLEKLEKFFYEGSVFFGLYSISDYRIGYLVLVFY